MRAALDVDVESCRDVGIVCSGGTPLGGVMSVFPLGAICGLTHGVGVMGGARPKVRQPCPFLNVWRSWDFASCLYPASRDGSRTRRIRQEWGSPLRPTGGQLTTCAGGHGTRLSLLRGSMACLPQLFSGSSWRLPRKRGRAMSPTSLDTDPVTLRSGGSA